MVIRLTLVSVVKEPDVSHVEHLVLPLAEEVLEVACWLSELRQPDHCWQIGLTTLKKCTLKSDIFGVACNSCFYKS